MGIPRARCGRFARHLRVIRDAFEDWRDRLVPHGMCPEKREVVRVRLPLEIVDRDLELEIDLIRDDVDPCGAPRLTLEHFVPQLDRLVRQAVGKVGSRSRGRSRSAWRRVARRRCSPSTRRSHPS